MNHDIETQLKRDARAIEQAVPPGMVARVRMQVERERVPQAIEERASVRPWLVAAAIVIAVGGVVWAINAMRGHDARVRNDPPLAVEHVQSASSDAPIAVAFALPAQGASLAARVGDPLSLEWERVKRDSSALLRDFERQIPRLPLSSE